jgi:VIT1/CCC1 family predicted Fe2+/Mn2+ transporter
MRNLNLAKDAFKKGDSEYSRLVHEKKAPKNTEEGHEPFGDFIKSVVYGGLDGILTSFAICSGAAGGGLSTHVVLVLGFSTAMANGLSMGLGDALSAQAEQELVMQERQREFWEYDHYKQGEIEEMIDLYKERGMSHDDAKRVIELIADHRAFFVDVMTVEELGLQLPEEDKNPWKEGFITFVSFVVFASLPLLGFIVFPWLFPKMSPDALFQAACGVTALALFLLGSVSAMFSAKKWYWGGLQMCSTGLVVALISFFVGSTAKQIVGVDADFGPDFF